MTNKTAVWWSNTKQFIKRDWSSNPFRFFLEITAWVISIGCAITYAYTVPEIPFIPLYCAFITGCVIGAWCAYTRGSFGLFGNYTLLAVIDMTGLIKLLLIEVNK